MCAPAFPRKPGMSHENRLPPVLAQPRQSGAGARLVEYRPWHLPNSALRGKAVVDFSGWVVAGIPILRRDDAFLSVGTPSAPQIDGQGQHRRNPDGRPQYSAIITFADKDAKPRWERSVLAALEAARVVP